MAHEVVTNTDLPRPHGPYSPVVRVGEVLYLSAQAGVDPATGAVPDGGFDAECRQVFANIERALKASGSDLGHIVKTTVFYVDLQELPTINKVYADVFPHDPPARSAAIVGLAGGRRISIDAIAILAKAA
ncbi:MAG: 2-iminobutanoate/2-iminopropanoate deaminase [Actinoplanes sp.]|jgi:2-iminobutanoate/2-iminopropanoate deaminase|nr:2-iminobutanoate/2-iminopropanoate deaminase [Actinoplanes sp.]